MRQQNNKTPLVFRIGIALVVLLIFSFHLTGGLYARYYASGNGADEVSVAKFSFDSDNLSAQAQNISVSLIPGESYSTTVKITNNGEVTLRYVVSLENLTDNLPIYDQTFALDTIPQGETRDVVWTLTWPQDQNSVDSMGKLDVLRIVVSVEQVD